MAKNILFLYIEWHFLDVAKGILKAWRNFLLFNLNYFSVPLLLKTFFSPWRKYKESYGRGLDIKKYFEAFASNMISRVLGAIVRSFLIIIGIAFEIFILFAGLIVFLAWIILPLLLIGGLYYGIKILV